MSHFKFYSADQFECQRELTKDIISFSIDRNSCRPIQDNYSNFIGKRLVGRVRNYDQEKDYGVISIPEINDEFSLKFSRLDSNQVDCVYSGDDIYCSIGRSDRGLHIKTIDGFVDSINNLQVEKCSIKIYKPERGYGFAFIGTTSNEAFFHKTAFPSNFYDYLTNGLDFEAEIRLNDNGKYQVRRCLALTQAHE